MILGGWCQYRSGAGTTRLRQRTCRQETENGQAAGCRSDSAALTHQCASALLPTPLWSQFEVPLSGCNPGAMGGCVKQGQSTKGSTYTSLSSP